MESYPALLTIPSTPLRFQDFQLQVLSLLGSKDGNVLWVGRAFLLVTYNGTNKVFR